MVVYGEKRLIKIAKKLSLPYWWIESVVIEYFPCRRFLEKGELWVFDFNIFDKKLIDEIPKKHVVIPQYFVAQNVTPKQLSDKILSSIVGEKSPSLPKEDVNPEGPLNKTAFPYLGNPIDVWDPKLSFHKKAVVNDTGILYQWSIAELYTRIPSSTWHKSDLFGMEEHWEVYQKLIELRKREILDNPKEEHKERAQELYNELERVRAPIREIIWQYHINHKKNFVSETKSENDFTIYDVLTKAGGEDITRTSLEPLFYKSAVRNLEFAKKARQKSQEDYSKYDIFDEIEFSITSIIAVINCLESYANNLILQFDLKIKLDENIRKKWKLITEQLTPSNKLESGEEPFKTFDKIVDWRNDAVHYKLHLKTKIEDRLLVHDRYKYENALMTINLVKEMINIVCKNPAVKFPSWISQEFYFE